MDRGDWQAHLWGHKELDTNWATFTTIRLIIEVPRWLSSKESGCQAGDTGSISGLERSPGEGNVNSLQYSCLGYPMDRRDWWATVPGLAKESNTI